MYVRHLPSGPKVNHHNVHVSLRIRAGVQHHASALLNMQVVNHNALVNINLTSPKAVIGGAVPKATDHRILGRSQALGRRLGGRPMESRLVTGEAPNTNNGGRDHD
jgi:hypothetical protein